MVHLRNLTGSQLKSFPFRRYDNVTPFEICASRDSGVERVAIKPDPANVVVSHFDLEIVERNASIARAYLPPSDTGQRHGGRLDQATVEPITAV